jgi:hypothetical protein
MDGIAGIEKTGLMVSSSHTVEKMVNNSANGLLKMQWDYWST